MPSRLLKKSPNTSFWGVPPRRDDEESRKVLILQTPRFFALLRMTLLAIFLAAC